MPRTIRKGILFYEYQIEFLDSLQNPNYSDHTRRAMDDYIQKMKKEAFMINISTSKSISKRGGDDERSRGNQPSSADSRQ